VRRIVVGIAAWTACLLGCADYRQKPIFPENAAHQPVLNEQALLGVAGSGDAAVAQLIDADGEPAQLELLIFSALGEPTREILDAPAAMAQAVSQRLRKDGHQALPLLEAAVRAEWPQALAKAEQLGFAAQPQALPQPGTDRIATSTWGSSPVFLRVHEVEGSPKALALLLSESASGPEVELARMTLSGRPVAPRLFLAGQVAWLLSGSVRDGEPLHRAVGVRRGLIGHGQSELHNLRGLSARAVGDLDGARREFARAIAADDHFVDPLYNAATTAALGHDDDVAVVLLERAAAADPARVQVLGRSDEALRQLRERKDVRDLLGLRRSAPENVPPPP
jgi:hypothetical protein